MVRKVPQVLRDLAKVHQAHGLVVKVQAATAKDQVVPARDQAAPARVQAAQNIKQQVVGININTNQSVIQ